VTVSTTPTTTSKRSSWSVPVGLAAALAVLLLIVFVVPDAKVDPSAAQGRVTFQEDDRNNDSSITTASDAEAECDPLYVQKDVGHTNGRVDDGFEKLVADTVAAKIAAGEPIEEGWKESILTATGYSAHNLAVITTPLGLYDDENNVAPLEKDGCLSRAGIQLHKELEIALNLTGTKLSETLAPENWYNSGVDANGTFGVANDQGIWGDRRAIMITLPNGNVVYVMIRCFNIPKPGQPAHLPKVITDNPPPPEKEKPKCPDGSPQHDDGTCPKGTEYRQAGDDSTRDAGQGTKPLVSANEAADDVAATVETEHVATTERETVTSSNDEPGTETGTVAEDAEEETVADPAVGIPENEGGEPVTEIDPGGF
jgi:hypothetical protein